MITGDQRHIFRNAFADFRRRPLNAVCQRAVPRHYRVDGGIFLEDPAAGLISVFSRREGACRRAVEIMLFIEFQGQILQALKDMTSDPRQGGFGHSFLNERQMAFPLPVKFVENLL